MVPDHSSNDAMVSMDRCGLPPRVNQLTEEHWCPFQSLFGVLQSPFSLTFVLFSMYTYVALLICCCRFFMTLSCLLELLMQAYLGVHENGAKVQKEQELASWVGSAGIQRTINGSGGFPALKSARREPGLDPIKGGLFALPLHLHCGSVDHCCQLPLSTSLQLLQRELELCDISSMVLACLDCCNK